MANYTPNTWTTGDTVTKTKLDRLEAGAAAALPSADAASTYAPITSTVRVLIYTGGAYPARPAGIPGGQVRYIGPVQPSDWLTNDEWVNNS